MRLASSITMVVSSISTVGGNGLQFARVVLSPAAHSTAQGFAVLKMEKGGKLEVTGTVFGVRPGWRYTEEMEFGLPGQPLDPAFFIAKGVAPASGTMRFSGLVRGISAIPELGWTLETVARPPAGGRDRTAAALGVVGTPAAGASFYQVALTPKYLVAMEVSKPTPVVWSRVSQGADARNGGVEIAFGPRRPVPQLTFPGKGAKVEAVWQVHVFNRATGAVVDSVSPSLRISLPGKPCSQGVVNLMPMMSNQLGRPDYHFAVRDRIPAGRYDVAVSLGGGNLAQFTGMVIGNTGS